MKHFSILALCVVLFASCKSTVTEPNMGSEKIEWNLPATLWAPLDFDPYMVDSVGNKVWMPKAAIGTSVIDILPAFGKRAGFWIFGLRDHYFGIDELGDYTEYSFVSDGIDSIRFPAVTKFSYWYSDT